MSRVRDAWAVLTGRKLALSWVEIENVNRASFEFLGTYHLLRQEREAGVGVKPLVKEEEAGGGGRRFRFVGWEKA